jgi:pantothenate kinase
MNSLLEYLLHCDTRILIGVAGIPGAGKTTLTAQLCQQLNQHFQSTVSIMVPMDGFHLTHAQLDALPNAAEAHRRRGAE